MNSDENMSSDSESENDRYLQKEFGKLRFAKSRRESPATKLNDKSTILFGFEVEKGKTHWVSGSIYRERYKETHSGKEPTQEHMDTIPSIIRNSDRNYFPKATLEFNLGLEKGKRHSAAQAILQDNGLTGTTYAGFKKHKGSYELPSDQKWKTTSTGIRLQQREFENPKHAGIENRSYLIRKNGGEIYSFDLKPADRMAKMSTSEIEKELGGTLYLKSTSSNGYFRAQYLNEKSIYGDGAQERHQSLSGIGRNTNRNLPEVVYMRYSERDNDTHLCSIESIRREKHVDRKLLDSLNTGARDVAQSVMVLSKNGGYSPVDYAFKNDPDFSRKMRKAGIDANIATHKFTKNEWDRHKACVPHVFVYTGNGILRGGATVARGLAKDETIARRFNHSEILVTNKSSSRDSIHPTGHYAQLLEAKRDIQKVHDKSLNMIHTDNRGEIRDDLASEDLVKDLRSPARESKNKRSGGTREYRRSDRDVGGGRCD